MNNRLKMIISKIDRGAVVADIGCDHARVPIYLVENKICERVLACDVKEGPLEKGRENIERYGYSDKIELRLSDGLVGVDAKECDTIIIAGMGGETIVSILEKARFTKKGEHKLILQPMTLPEQLRYFLYTNGYEIMEESLAQEGEKVYLCIVAKGGAQGFKPQSEAACIVSKKLENDELREKYYKSLYNRYKKAADGISAITNERELTSGEKNILELTEILERELI